MTSTCLMLLIKSVRITKSIEWMAATDLTLAVLLVCAF